MNDLRTSGSSTPAKIRIDTHARALAFAQCLSADFEQAHVAALTDTSGVVFNGATLTEDYHQIEHAVGFAMCVSTIVGSEAVGAVTLFSVAEHDVTTLSCANERIYHRTGTLFEGWIEVRDWIITDGAHYRSLAYSVDPVNAWPDDPVRARTAVLDSDDPGYW